MVDPDTQALAIFDLMCSTGGDRPFAGNSVQELTRTVNAWQSANPALTILRESEPAVHLAFLERSYDRLKANGDIRGDFRLCATLNDAIGISLRAYPEPLPSDLLLDLITQYGRDHSMAKFYVDLPSDRNRALRDSALAEESGTGISLFIGSDQVRFYREQRETAVDEVPALVYSEIMRDVDLFTSVCAVGDDETWSDQGDRGVGVLVKDFDLVEFTAIIALRATCFLVCCRTRLSPTAAKL